MRLHRKTDNLRLNLCSAIYRNAGPHTHLYTGKKQVSAPFPWPSGQEDAAQPLVGQARAPWCSTGNTLPHLGDGLWALPEIRAPRHITEHCDPQHKGELTERILNGGRSVREEDENKLSDSTGEVEEKSCFSPRHSEYIPTPWLVCCYPSAWCFGVNVSVNAMTCTELRAARSDMHYYSQGTWNLQATRGQGRTRPSKPQNIQNGSLCWHVRPLLHKQYK